MNRHADSSPTGGAEKRGLKKILSYMKRVPMRGDKVRIIDSHVHMGCNVKTKYYSEEELCRDLQEAGAQGAVIFAFPEDIYRIVDSVESRLRANEYILDVAEKSPDLYPFYFVWNDYLIPENVDRYSGIKWHRHYDEPMYDYDSPKCREFLKNIKKLEMPVLLEEEFKETERFIEKNPETVVIIPHMGYLNGGYDQMQAFHEKKNVYFDTSTASFEAIEKCLETVGRERVIFGSDVSGTQEPFYNFPKVEIEKLRKLNLKKKDLELILSGNIERIISKKM